MRHHYRVCSLIVICIIAATVGPLSAAPPEKDWVIENWPYGSTTNGFSTWELESPSSVRAIDNKAPSACLSTEVVGSANGLVLHATITIADDDDDLVAIILNDVTEANVRNMTLVILTGWDVANGDRHHAGGDGSVSLVEVSASKTEAKELFGSWLYEGIHKKVKNVGPNDGWLGTNGGLVVKQHWHHRGPSLKFAKNCFFDVLIEVESMNGGEREVRGSVTRTLEGGQSDSVEIPQTTLTGQWRPGRIGAAVYSQPCLISIYLYPPRTWLVLPDLVTVGQPTKVRPIRALPNAQIRPTVATQIHGGSRATDPEITAPVQAAGNWVTVPAGRLSPFDVVIDASALFPTVPELCVWLEDESGHRVSTVGRIRR